MTLPTRLIVDVAVVGGGPAGLAAAEAAARAGAWVILVEAKPEIGARCHCAEWVPALLAGEAEIPKDVRRMATDSLECRAGDQRAVARVKGWVIDRPAWERGMKQRVLWQGVSLVCGARAKGFDERGKLVIQGKGRAVHIKAGAVIAADGALSPLARLAGLPRLAGVPALQQELAAGPGEQKPIVSFRPDLVGYQWCFPKGETVNIGLGGKVLGDASLKDMLGQWRADLRADDVIADIVVRRGGGWLPGQGLRPVVHQTEHGTALLLAGDAAGLTHPTSGAGITQAVISGRMAGMAAARIANGERDAATEYEADLQGRFGGYLERGAAALQEARALWQDDFIQAVKTYWPLWPRRSTADE